MDLYRLARPADAARRERLLAATKGRSHSGNARCARRPAPERPLPAGGSTAASARASGWTTCSPSRPGSQCAARAGTGSPPTRWRGTSPYEWIESYLYDHRPTAADGTPSPVPSLRRRGRPLLCDPAVSLFRHDAGSGFTSYWGRGNGWAAWGLARAARYLDTPYGGGRYDEVRRSGRDPRGALAPCERAGRAPVG